MPTSNSSVETFIQQKIAIMRAHTRDMLIYTAQISKSTSLDRELILNASHYAIHRALHSFLEISNMIIRDKELGCPSNKQAVLSILRGQGVLDNDTQKNMISIIEFYEDPSDVAAESLDLATKANEYAAILDKIADNFENMISP